MSCECKAYCMEHEAQVVGHVPEGFYDQPQKRLCYNVTGERARLILNDPESLSVEGDLRLIEYRVDPLDGALTTRVGDGALELKERLVLQGGQQGAATSAASCPKGCSGKGICIRTPNNSRTRKQEWRQSRKIDSDVKFKCHCMLHSTQGPACKKPVGNVCPLGCSGRGVCKDHSFCHCLPGYWGMDCAQSMGHDGRPVLFDGRGKERYANATPNIYIYDFGGSGHHQYQSYFGRAAVLHNWVGDYARAGQSKLRDRLLASAHRTLDPERAHYFYIPIHFTASSQGAVDFIRAKWPWFDELNGKRHLLFTANDGGADEMYRFWDMKKYKLGRVEGTATPIFMQHVGVIQHMGQLVGTQAQGLKFGGMFRPGLDILLPPEQPVDLKNLWRHAPWFGGRDAVKAAGGGREPGEEKGKVFFAGTIYLGEQSVRAMVYKALHGRPGMRMYAKSIQSHYYGNMTTSQFCLAPPGMRGGWGRRTTLVATFGCIPLVVEDNRVQPFEDIYDPDSYTVRVLEKDVDSIGELVDSISEEKISAMRRTIDCLIPKWMWSSMHGAMPTAASRMTDADDVFGALMLLLRRRIAGATGFVDPCKPIDGGALPRELCIKDNSRHISRSVPANELPRGIIPCSDADVARVGAWEDALNDAGVVSGDKGQRGGARIHQILKMQPGGASCVGLNPPGPPC